MMSQWRLARDMERRGRGLF